MLTLATNKVRLPLVVVLSAEASLVVVRSRGTTMLEAHAGSRVPKELPRPRREYNPQSWIRPVRFPRMSISTEMTLWASQVPVHPIVVRCVVLRMVARPSAGVAACVISRQ